MTERELPRGAAGDTYFKAKILGGGGISGALERDEHSLDCGLRPPLFDLCFVHNGDMSRGLLYFCQS